MKVVPPITITDAILTSSTVAEPSGADPSAWSNATAYVIGNLVYLASTHRVYECIQGNTNHDPSTDTANTYWIDAGPTNRWKMFDLLRSTGSIGSSPMTVVLTPGVRVDSIGAFGLVADSITVTVTSDGDEVYSASLDLRTRETVTWYDYFFDDFDIRSEFARFDLPPYTDAVVTVTLTRATGNITCGGIVLGRFVDLGRTIHGAQNDADNFSKIARDDNGVATLQQKRTVPKNNATTILRKEAVNKALKAREDLNAVPAMWSGLDDATSGYFAPLLILGVYKQFTITMDQPDTATLTLSLEEI